MIRMSRRQFAAGAAAAGLIGPGVDAAENGSLITRPIPSSGEPLPAVGLGTARVFNRDDEPTRRAAAQVLDALTAAGGRLVDTASTYGDAEAVLGSVIAGETRHGTLFIATKVEAADAAELKRSLTRLETRKLDLLQLHNVRDPQQSLARFRDWKAEGACRYVGITSTFHGDFPAIEAVLSREKPDFVQIDYSIDDRSAEARILPLAADVKCAVLTALPFGRGRLFRAVRAKALPEWADEFAGSWAQFFLKYLLGDERVTVVIPGTADAAHMADNAGAMRGRLPAASERKRMLEFIASL
jgi:aryl-alcohol dehydrogenase-like predicted oxidoreductase